MDEFKPNRYARRKIAALKRGKTRGLDKKQAEELIEKLKTGGYKQPKKMPWHDIG